MGSTADCAQRANGALTRREMLARSGAAYLVVLGAGFAWPAATRAALAEGTGLSGARRATLGAVLAAVAEDPGTGVTNVEVAPTLEWFAGFYEGASPPFREHADDVLDRLEIEPQRAPFSTLAADAARDVLRGWSAAAAEPGPVPDPRAALAASALELASLTFDGDDLRQVGYVLEPA
jgi:hypothetical protein